MNECVPFLKESFFCKIMIKINEKLAIGIKHIALKSKYNRKQCVFHYFPNKVLILTEWVIKNYFSSEILNSSSIFHLLWKNKILPKLFQKNYCWCVPPRENSLQKCLWLHKWTQDGADISLFWLCSTMMIVLHVLNVPCTYLCWVWLSTKQN